MNSRYFPELQECRKRHLLAGLARAIDRNKGRRYITTGDRPGVRFIERDAPVDEPLYGLYLENIVPDVSQVQPDRTHANVRAGLLTWINLVARDIHSIEDLRDMCNRDQAHPERIREQRTLRLARLQIKPQPAILHNNRAIEEVPVVDPRFTLYCYRSGTRPVTGRGYDMYQDFEVHYAGALLQYRDLMELFIAVNDAIRRRTDCYVYSGVDTHRLAWASEEMAHELNNVDAEDTPEVVRDFDRWWFRVKFGTRATEDMIRYWTVIKRRHDME